jgi:hypothetical protein
VFGPSANPLAVPISLPWLSAAASPASRVSSLEE